MKAVNLVVLSIKDLNVHYADHHALKNLSLDLLKGELLGVIGPNGAGKTSFIKALCGRVDCHGQIIINEIELKRGHDRRKLLGLVPQDIGLYPQLTAYENLEVIARLLGAPKKSLKNDITKALQSVDMYDKKDILVKNLSGGMKRRINVAAAIMHNPDVIIFDEPTAGVDVPARDVVHRLARKLTELDKTVILITHELEQAEALCDKILLLHNGDTLACDSAANILSSYFGATRQVSIRFTTEPSTFIRNKLQAANFSQGELSTIWLTETTKSETGFVSDFMQAIDGNQDAIREITVRRPGLPALMHHLNSKTATPS